MLLIIPTHTFVKKSNNMKKISAEDQIQRLNKLVQSFQAMQELPLEILTYKPHAKQWNIVEIVDHLNAAYKLYRFRFDELLPKLAASNENIEIQPRGMAKWSIRSMSPNKGKRKSRMKTFKRFYPATDLVQPTSAAVNRTFDLFYDHQQHLKQVILESRTKNVKQAKITSAIGPIVKFYLPEAFEFLIGHEERHLLQAEEYLAAQQSVQLKT